MNIARRVVLRFAFTLAFSALAGCGSTVEKPATEAVVTIRAAAEVNPAADGAATPVQVSVYELAGSTGFAQARFFALRENESAALGADLISRETVILPPGSEKRLNLKLDPRTRYLGVTAAFAQIEEARWKGVAQVTPFERNEILVEVGGLSIHAAKK